MGVNVSSTKKVGSDYVNENCCDLCEREGQQKEAVGYCSNCLEYLCMNCLRHHTRSKPSRHHVLLNQHQMPKIRQQKQGTDSLSSALKGGSDFVYEDCCNVCEGKGQQKEAVGYCSNCREYLCTDCFRHHTRPKSMRHHVLLDQLQMPKETQTSTSPENVSVPVSDAEDRVSRISSQQDTLVRGEIKKYARHEKDLRVGYVSDCVVLPGDKLVLVGGNHVKLVDITHGNVVSLLWQPLCDSINLVSSTQVAVTSSYKQIIFFVNVDDKLKFDREIKVNGECFGIARINDNIVVSYKTPVKVEILTMEGNVLQTVVKADKDKQLFGWWNVYIHIAVSNDQQTIYMSNFVTNTITSVDLAGRVRAKCKIKGLTSPCGLTIDRAGMVYVCGHESHNVLQLTADLSKGRLLLQQSDCINYPRSLCYCQATDRLYLGQTDSNMLSVFQML